MFGDDEQLRDLNVSEILTKKNIEFETFNDQVVFNPGTIKTQENKPYSVFTPFLFMKGFTYARIMTSNTVDGQDYGAAKI